MNKQIDVRGKPCPEPVVLTKKELDNPQVQSLEVTTDSEISKENIIRLIQTYAYPHTLRQDGNNFILTITKNNVAVAPDVKVVEIKDCCTPANYVVYISSDLMGQGEPALGEILMNSFLKTLKDVSPLPQKILFVNKGVFLTIQDSKFLPTLQEIEQKGVVLLSCGTCLDFYHCKEKLAVGKVTNMFEIVESLRNAGKIVHP